MNLYTPSLLTIDKYYPSLAQTLSLTQLHNLIFFTGIFLSTFFLKKHEFICEILKELISWLLSPTLLLLSLYPKSPISLLSSLYSLSFFKFFLFLLLHSGFFCSNLHCFHTYSNISLFSSLLFSNQS